MERIDYEDLDRRLKSPDWRVDMNRDELRLLFTIARSSVSRELYEARWRERNAVIEQCSEAIAERDKAIAERNAAEKRLEDAQMRDDFAALAGAEELPTCKRALLDAANDCYALRKQRDEARALRDKVCIERDVITKECNTLRQQRDEAREACKGHEASSEAMQKRMVHLLREFRGKIMGIAPSPDRHDAMAWAEDQLAAMGDGPTLSECKLKFDNRPNCGSMDLDERTQEMRSAGATLILDNVPHGSRHKAKKWLEDVCATMANVRRERDTAMRLARMGAVHEALDLAGAPRDAACEGPAGRKPLMPTERINWLRRHRLEARVNIATNYDADGTLHITISEVKP